MLVPIAKAGVLVAAVGAAFADALANPPAGAATPLILYLVGAAIAGGAFQMMWNAWMRKKRGKLEDDDLVARIMKQTMEGAKGLLDEYRLEVEVAKRQIAAYQEQLANLNQQIGAANERIGKLERDLLASNQDRGDLHADLVASKADRERLHIELKRALGERDALYDEIRDVKDQIRELRDGVVEFPLGRRDPPTTTEDEGQS